MSPAEIRLWGSLKGAQLGGLKFRRQVALGHFVADFYCPAARLVVEVDGKTHTQNREHDSNRDSWMKSVGLGVIRITTRELAIDFDAVCRTIANTAMTRIKMIDERKSY